MKIEEMVYEMRCQKCDTLPVITPLAELKGPIEGTIRIPASLLCAKCGILMTTIVRKIRDEEKPKKE